ncbi:aldose 1-epimerase family protein [Thermobispora bispora]|jgi:aldose 1-epimerase|uniref:Aldose 1-epimerase n=1 Tax=Thermobispora bispora (strain ATCC 19993 / DSM 43833 / CBS 139.67 / JCM 10125 / KCTC 9307 / NBRC 14880 / R51) TaxID=469371 RepID=D6YBP9_THEBD|nr:aldose 1-epimerase family protein [Thermobispora bispora]MBO2475760.1 aldose epimerase [Actinomycetales bacterium]MDI9579172.1 aldose 1-epimerase family protein [Thermobispora sp.]ADG88609.1 Aldose 1-epimerase [Thermobispora bispora DSM 43833]MBX6166775.1 aldose 1-epimerase family protein [Thermobispora bispora]QSI48396.1 aldose epimerase [Thermobispora bispora]
MADDALVAGRYEARISRRGGALRTLRHDGRDLVTGWPADGPIPHYSGTVLAPWPNRVVGGTYDFAGVTHKLPINEPERGHALHGLVTDRIWDRAEQAGDGALRLTHTIEPVEGYPFRIDLEVRYELTPAGLTATLTARNTGDEPAPYGCGWHPWLLAGPDVREYELDLPADRVLLTDESLAPTELVDVAGTPYRFHPPRRIGDTVIDHAFTGVTEGRVRVRGPEGGVEISWDPAVMPWVQVCTGTGLGHRGLAVEPMTCPPGAFNSGTGVIVLEPGATHRAAWTISALEG